MQGEAAPGRRGCRDGLPRAAAATGNAATRAAGARPLASRAPARIWAQEKLGPERQLVTDI